MSWADMIQATLAPVVLISAIALINLSLYNRYARIHDRIRHLLSDIEALAQMSEQTRTKKIADKNVQIELLLERGRLLKWSLLLLQLALVACAVDSVLIFLNIVRPLQLELVIITVFGFGVSLILLGTIIVAIETSKSLKGLCLEVETVRKG